MPGRTRNDDGTARRPALAYPACYLFERDVLIGALAGPLSPAESESEARPCFLLDLDVLIGACAGPEDGPVFAPVVGPLPAAGSAANADKGATMPVTPPTTTAPRSAARVRKAIWFPPSQRRPTTPEAQHARNKMALPRRNSSARWAARRRRLLRHQSRRRRNRPGCTSPRTGPMEAARSAACAYALPQLSFKQICDCSTIRG